jgi:hypothetical protein
MGPPGRPGVGGAMHEVRKPEDPGRTAPLNSVAWFGHHAGESAVYAVLSR